VCVSVLSGFEAVVFKNAHTASTVWRAVALLASEVRRRLAAKGFVPEKKISKSDPDVQFLDGFKRVLASQIV
jgi:hypothetical protein